MCHFCKLPLKIWTIQDQKLCLTPRYWLVLKHQHYITAWMSCLLSSECFPDYPQESPQVKSPWSESMSQLMRKLDQLNLDIEEALSASSSPSDTPCTARKKQVRACLHNFIAAVFGTHTELTVCVIKQHMGCSTSFHHQHAYGMCTVTVGSVRIPVTRMPHSWSCFLNFPKSI